MHPSNPRSSTPLLLLWSLLTGLALTGCAASKHDLTYSENQYQQACEATRSGKKPSQQHMKNLLYDPKTAEQEGVFFISAFNPLGHTQFECDTFVLNDQGEQVYSALPTLSKMKADKDGTMFIQLIAYTFDASANPESIKVKLRLQRDNGEMFAYDTQEEFNLTPEKPECTQQACRYIYTKAITTRIHEADRNLFTEGERIHLRIEPLSGENLEYTFNLPES